MRISIAILEAIVHTPEDGQSSTKPCIEPVVHAVAFAKRLWQFNVGKRAVEDNSLARIVGKATTARTTSPLLAAETHIVVRAVGGGGMEDSLVWDASL